MGAHSRWVSHARPTFAAITAVAATLALSGGTALAVTPAWTLVSSPNVLGTPQDNDLNGVSCVGATFCMAVGDAAGVTLTERWNGKSWAVVRSPNGGAAGGGQLNAVSCTSTTFCLAVGSYGHGSAARNLTEKWNGARWSKVTAPNPSATQGNSLYGISCPSATVCMAVGSYFNGTVNQAMAMKWNGTSWALVTAADTSTSVTNQLIAVSCTSATFCLAVGVQGSPPNQGLAERWNGKSWTLKVPVDPGAQSEILEGVKCTSATFCLAVGSASDGVHAQQTLVQKWNGATWTVLTTADSSKSQNNRLTAISCANSGFCTAVGHFYNGSVDQNLALKWNGTTWSRTTAPSSSTSQVNDLTGVSCPSTSLCVAVGQYQGRSGYFQAQALKWTGTGWAKLSPPSVSGPSSNYLAGVSCTGSTFCMAVGDVATGVSADQALAQRWNGTNWATVSSLSGSKSQGTDLTDVSCVSASFCMAVGTFWNGTAEQAWTEKWNGSKWAKVTIPDTSPTLTNALSWVSCTSASFCMAVGSSIAGAHYQTLAEKWNGTSWSLLSTPDSSSSQDNHLQGVSCTSTTFCLAVGLYSTGTANLTVAQKWNGASWTTVPSPDPVAVVNVLYGVSCTSATFCMAVGGERDTLGNEATLAVTWDGHGLTTVASANTVTVQNNELHAVSCTSSTFCMAGGYYYSGDPYQTLAERWSGTSWTLLSSPDRTASENYLNGMSCTSSTFCMAVGSNGTSTVNQTLIERW